MIVYSLFVDVAYVLVVGLLGSGFRFKFGPELFP